MRWMKLEPIIQSQKEKHQHSILTHIYGILKMLMTTLYEREKKRHRCKEQLDSVGEGKGGVICKNSIETCILPYMK